MNIIYRLEEIKPEQLEIVGKQALHLSQLQRDGFPVISGLLLSSHMFGEFLQLSLATATLEADFLNLDVHNYQELQAFGQQSSQKILASEFPAEWLNILGQAISELSTPMLSLYPSVTTIDHDWGNWQRLILPRFAAKHTQSLGTKIKQLWAGLCDAKNLFFLHQQKVALTQVKLAVLIQPCYQAIASGMITFEQELYTIASTWGQQLARDKGEVASDIYHFHPKSQKIIRQELGNKIVAYNPHDSELERYLLTETEQQSYSLTSPDLEKLMDLTLKLVQAYPKISYCNWILAENSTIYISEADLTPTTSSMSSLQPQSTLMIQGLGASPGQAIAPAQVVSGSDKNYQKISPQTILVLKSLTPDWLPVIKKAVGIVTEIGGMTSHSAIMARELGIPAIVGAKQATHLIKSDQVISIDGNTGRISLATTNPSSPPEVTTQTVDSTDQFYPISTQLLVNLSQRESIPAARQLPVDGVGLLRSELFCLELLQQKSLPVWIQTDKAALIEEFEKFITPFSQAFSPNPVFYRSINWYALNLPESCTKFRQELFQVQLQALLNLLENRHTNLKILLPFVRSVAEFKIYLQKIQETGLREFPSFQVWIMAEVPSALFLLPEYVKAGVQGISIGTNDLSQFLLGINREDPVIISELNINNLALKKWLKEIIIVSQQLEIPCSICGQVIVEDSTIIRDLIGWGIDSLSVEIQSISQIYRAIARAEQNIILAAARGNFKQSQ